MSGRKILIVEDDAAEASLLSDLVQKFGHITVGPVQSAEEAVPLAKEAAPDMVLMDIRLPGKDGLWAAREIIAQRQVGIIFLTGYDEDVLISAASESGGLAYLIKPIERRQLEAAIELAWARFSDITNLRAQLTSMEEALEARKKVERAKGILMDRLSLSENEAYRRLQKRARDTNQKLAQVAAAVIASAGTLWLEEEKQKRVEEKER